MGQISAKTTESELSDIKTKEELYIANEKSKLLQKEEDLKTSQAIAEIEIEEKRVNLDKKQKKMELSIPNRQEEVARYSELLKVEKSFYELQESVNSKKAKSDLATTIEQIKVDEQRASYEQLPQLAESLSNIFKGANLSFYNEDNDLMKNLSPLIEMISSRVKK